MWLATEPMDMRAGTDTALARVVKVFGAAHPHQGHFVWPTLTSATQASLIHAQLDALVLGLPWQRIGEGGIITLV